MLELAPAPELSREEALEDLHSLGQLEMPGLEELPPELSDEDRRQMLFFLTQQALDEKQISQKLSRIIQVFGSGGMISSPDFSAGLYPKRLNDEDLIVVPSLLHLYRKDNGTKPGFGASIPLWPDYSLDPRRQMKFFMYGQDSLENAGPVLNATVDDIKEIIVSQALWSVMMAANRLPSR